MRLMLSSKVFVIRLLTLLMVFSAFSCRTRSSSSGLRSVSDINADLDRALWCNQVYHLENSYAVNFDLENTFNGFDVAKQGAECRGESSFEFGDPAKPDPNNPRAGDAKDDAKKMLDKATELNLSIKSLEEENATNQKKADEWKKALDSTPAEKKEELQRNITVMEATVRTGTKSLAVSKSLYDKLADDIKAQGKLIENVENGILKAISDIKGDLQTRPILRQEDVDKSLFNRLDELQKSIEKPGPGQEFLKSTFSRYPRAELRYREETSHARQFNLGADLAPILNRLTGGVLPTSKLPGVTGEVKSPLTIKSKLFGYQSTRKYFFTLTVAGEGLKPLLNADGFFTRYVSTTCQVSTADVVEKSAGIEGSLDVPFLSAGGKYEYTSLVDINSVRIGDIRNLPLGEKSKDNPDGKVLTIASEVANCRKFAENIRDRDPIDPDLKVAYESLTEPRKSCKDDFDCRDELIAHKYINSTKPENFRMISDCRINKDIGVNICSKAVGLEGAACIIPISFAGESDTIELPCAKGLVCSSLTNKCAVDNLIDPAFKTGSEPGEGGTTRSPAIALKMAGLNDVRYLREEFIRFDDVEVNKVKIKQIAKGYENRVVDQVCANELGQGWRLPKENELWAVAVVDRETKRDAKKEEVLKSDDAINASASPQGNKYYSPGKSWYYPDELYQGYIWSSDPYVWLRSLESKSTLNLKDQVGIGKFLKALGNNSTEIPGAMYCVK